MAVLRGPGPNGANAKSHMRAKQRAIEATLIAYIREECLSRHGKVELADETNLFEAGIVDSAGLLSFIGFIEKEYGLTVPDEDLLPENFVTIARIAKYIRAHLRVQPA
jgi:acyl carrier protein